MRWIFPLVFLSLAAPALAQTAEDGAELYMSRCAACHGETAEGDGPMSGLMTIPMPDLTQLSARNDGLFPRGTVVRTIDGRIMLRGHGGDGPMPVFGPILGGGSAVVQDADGNVIQTRGDVVSIALYLESVQAGGN